jgi:hypothetical protein
MCSSVPGWYDLPHLHASLGSDYVGLLDGDQLPHGAGHLCQLPTTQRTNNMNDREILAAALRWHTAHKRRLEIGAEQRRYQAEQKQRNGFGGSDSEIGQRLTASKRVELAALRALAKVCAGVRGSQKHTVDADVIDVPMLLTCNRFTD